MSFTWIQPIGDQKILGQKKIVSAVKMNRMCCYYCETTQYYYLQRIYIALSNIKYLHTEERKKEIGKIMLF